jgi:protein required for attachment to host cells
MKPIVTWIVAADGGRVRVFENRGPGKGMLPVKGLNFEDAHLKGHEINADRAGRTSSAQGQGSAMTPPTDPVEQQEAAFARMVADVLKTRYQNGAFTRLIIAADPAALGNLRSALCEQVDRTVMAELHKDLTKIPLAEMPRHFEGLLAV